MTHNTTEGINFVSNGLEMKEADEVIVSNTALPGAIHPWRLKEKRRGIVIKEVPCGLPPKSVYEVVDAIAAVITARTKIISIGHTIYISGLVSPIKEVC